MKKLKLSFLLITLILASCKTTDIYQKTKVKGCKGVRLINFDKYVKVDTSATVIKKNLAVLDNILNKTLSLGSDTVSIDQYVEINKKSSTTRSLTTPKEIVTAYNSKLNLLCAKQEELRKIVKDDSYPQSFRLKAENKYFEILDDYTSFTNQLSGQIKKN